MDNFIENVSGYSMWDIRNAIDKVTAKVMNLTEMEQKVREATSNDPWGASGTLKQELAQATHNFQYFNEIMPAIFKRFAEKEPREWRQIYKALVLLEYLVTHGSERVVDEARGHISTIKVLRSFQYVDENGKDEGINVRNRAKEFAEMLSSVDRIKEERKKAKANRNKFVGSEGGGFAGTGSKYGGFGSDSYYEGGSGGGGYGGSTGSGGSRGSSRYDDRSSSRSNRYDDEDRDPSNSPPVRRTTRKTETSKPVAKVEPVKEVNLFDFDEPTSVSSAPVNQNAFGGSATKSAAALDDGWGSLQSATDDFDDFQSAPPVETKNQASVPSFPAYNPTMASVLPPVRTNSSASNNNNGFGAFGGSSGGSAFDLLGGAPSNGGSNFGGSIQPMAASTAQAKPATSSFPIQNNNNTGSSNSNDIWSNASGLISLDGLGKTKTKEAAPSMNALAANSWNSGSWASKPSANTTPSAGSNAFGNFGSMATNTQSNSNNKNSNNNNNNNNNFNDLLF
ncbi:Epsin-3, clathrin recruitment and traffic between the Golgi and endosome [Linnemannia exigua]|uniref:Epsin-3, clathrin recruitment and traffic between the Golgi and endosome n=1 Tax=Linnemannia exigua TaxID=604196 RepID=A0AAD4DHC4_9FUNG|nr:Epsin-3, clathrin recruitment and traffic between the Golgi and endosome [Linnemannia exigua]